MSTERSDGRPIIASSGGGTSREQGPVISSEKAISALSAGASLSLGSGSYEIIREVASSGEAEVFLLRGPQGEQILKHYFSNYRPKQEIISKLSAMKQRDIMYPLFTGTHQGRFYEIVEYMRGGTLDEMRPLRDMGLIRQYVGQISAAMHACHQGGIIHRDIKPVNIFFRDKTRKEIVIGDFGIASPLQEGTDYRFTTSVNRTNVYAAPELFTNINNQTTLDIKVDYYALGISLLELWQGEDPFKGQPEFMSMRLKIEGRINVPPDLNPDLKKLIKGLLVTEPPRRWGFQEISKWLRGESVSVYESTPRQDFKPYEWDRARNIVLYDPRELANYMEADRVKAARQLYSKSIPDWTRNVSPDLFSELTYLVDKEYPNISDVNTRAGVTKAIYILDRGRSFRGVAGKVCDSVKDLAAELETRFDLYKQELKNPSSDLFLFLEAREFADRAALYRKYFKEYNEERALNLVILDLQENKLNIGGKVYENEQQLMAAPPDILRKVCKDLAREDSKVSLWIEVSRVHLTKSVNTWRSEPAFQRIDTLHYAFQTGGFRINNEEALDGEEFYSLFEKNLRTFTHPHDGDQWCKEATYWLENYTSFGFYPLLLDFLAEGNAEFEDLMAVFTLFVKTAEETYPDSNPLPSVSKFSEAHLREISSDPAKIEKFAALYADDMRNYLLNSENWYVYQVEKLQEDLKPLTEEGEVIPGFLRRFEELVDDTIQSFIDDDHKNIAGNPDAFGEYRLLLKSFMEDVIQPLNPSAACYRHWKKEEELIAAAAARIGLKYSEEQEQERQKTERQFSDYIRDRFDAATPYRKYFKRYLMTVLFTIVLLTGYFTTVFYGLAFKLVNTGIAAIFSVVAIGLALLVKVLVDESNSKVNRDSLRSKIGRSLFSPILRKLMQQDDQEIVSESLMLKNEALDKLDLKKEAAMRDELFEESIAICLSSE